MDDSQPKDEQLLREALAGDEAAFTGLYRRRQAGIFRFALQMSGSWAVAEDVTQDVFLALIREGGRFDERRGPLVAYLYGIARKRILRWLEKEKTELLSEDTRESVVATGDPASDLERDQSIRAVRDAVLALPAHYREVAVLCELQELSYEDAAGALGCAVGTVRSRLHRARGLLAEKLRLGGAAGPSSGEVSPARSFV